MGRFLDGVAGLGVGLFIIVISFIGAVGSIALGFDDWGYMFSAGVLFGIVLAAGSVVFSWVVLPLKDAVKKLVREMRAE